ncbi:MAG: iron ABC transporter substrate-binding protein [Acidimicrobiia bacterium]
MKHVTIILLAALAAAACAPGSGADGKLVVYSGRGQELVEPLLQRFREQSDLAVEVRYAGSTELAATLLEEGQNSPADVFFAQDPASLGAVAAAGLLATLPDEVLGRVPARFRDAEGRWVGTSGRARVMVYNTEALSEAELPRSIWELTDPNWKGRVAIAPTNGSFLAFVSAMILTDGEGRTLEWLEGIAANDPVIYQSNAPIVAAADAGEVDLGLVNHYYLLRLEGEQGRVSAANHFLRSGDPGALVMPAGVGVLTTSQNPAAALELVRFLLSEEAQRYFSEETFEYPLVSGVPPSTTLPPLEEIPTPDVNLSHLADTIDQATDLVAEAGLL